MVLDRAVAACQHLPCAGAKCCVPMTWQSCFGRNVGYVTSWGVWPCTMDQGPLSMAPPAAIPDGKPRLICSRGGGNTPEGAGCHCHRSRSVSLRGCQAERGKRGSGCTFENTMLSLGLGVVGAPPASPMPWCLLGDGPEMGGWRYLGSWRHS